MPKESYPSEITDQLAQGKVPSELQYPGDRAARWERQLVPILREFITQCESPEFKPTNKGVKITKHNQGDGTQKTSLSLLTKKTDYKLSIQSRYEDSGNTPINLIFDKKEGHHHDNPLEVIFYGDSLRPSIKLPDGTPKEQDAFLQKHTENLKQFLFQLNNQQNIDRPNLKRQLAMLAVALAVINSLLEACTTTSEERQVEKALTHLIYGTPVPAKELEPVYKKAQQASVELGLVDVGICSGTLISGNIIGRPDLGIILTAKHCMVYQESGELARSTLTVNIPSQQGLYEFIQPEEQGIYVDPDRDIAYIVVKIRGRQTLTKMFEHAVTNVDDTWDGTGNVVASGFPLKYLETLREKDPKGAQMPLVEIQTPLNQKGYDDEAVYSGAMGKMSSGGGIYNELNAVCGVHTSGYDEISLTYHAMIRNFAANANLAAADLEAH